MVSEHPASRSCTENIIYSLFHLVTRHKKAAAQLPGALPPLKRRHGRVGVFFMLFERIIERLSDDRRADPRDNAETGNDRRGRNDRTHLFNRRLTSDCTAL